MAQGDEEEIIIIGGGTKPKGGIVGDTESHASRRLRILREDEFSSPYEIAHAMIDEAEAFNLPITFETRKAKG